MQTAGVPDPALEVCSQQQVPGAGERCGSCGLGKGRSPAPGRGAGGADRAAPATAAGLPRPQAAGGRSRPAAALRRGSEPSGLLSLTFLAFAPDIPHIVFNPERLFFGNKHCDSESRS